MTGPDTLPSRIILSRKGADAAWGGRASLRVGRDLISLPIPESDKRARAAQQAGTGTRYGDLPPDPLVGALHTHLRNVAAEHYVHLDPDLRPALRALRTKETAPEWIFGQEGAAEGHLRRQGVGPGDLFLFFGWFREAVPTAAGWKRVGPEEHCLWGWLQIAESHLVASAQQAKALPWAAHHPHVAHWERYDSRNRIYRARRRLSFASHLPGAGVFRWHPGLTLTQRCAGDGKPPTRREWCLPPFFRQTGLTYNQVDGPPCSCSRGRVHLSSAPIGQEFVLPAHRPFRPRERQAVGRWLEQVFAGADGV